MMTWSCLCLDLVPITIVLQPILVSGLGGGEEQSDLVVNKSVA